MEPLRVLILCTGNSCRSQLAEGLFKMLAGDQIFASSAGIRPEGYVHPLAIKAMDELGVDMSKQYSKSVELYQGQQFDTVITVCDSAARSCPTFPGSPTILHWPTDDPFDAQGSEDERLAIYRRIRDELRQRIEGFLAEHLRPVG